MAGDSFVLQDPFAFVLDLGVSFWLHVISLLQSITLPASLSPPLLFRQVATSE
jgi:hypothetical protein